MILEIDEYKTFIDNKKKPRIDSGFKVAHLNENLFEFQKCRYAIFIKRKFYNLD